MVRLFEKLGPRTSPTIRRDVSDRHLNVTRRVDSHVARAPMSHASDVVCVEDYSKEGSVDVVDLTRSSPATRRKKKAEQDCVIVGETKGKKRPRCRPPTVQPQAVEIVDPVTLASVGPGPNRMEDKLTENARKCSVCLGDIEKMSSTTCGHVFCWDCIRRAVSTQQKCPTCRKKLNAKQIHRIYL